MYIWLVVHTWSHDDGSDFSIRVFNNVDSAKNAFEEKIQEIIKDIGNDMEKYSVDKDEFSFHIYRDGFVNEDNDYIVCQKKLVE